MTDPKLHTCFSYHFCFPIPNLRDRKRERDHSSQIGLFIKSFLRIIWIKVIIFGTIWGKIKNDNVLFFFQQLKLSCSTVSHHFYKFWCNKISTDIIIIISQRNPEISHFNYHVPPMIITKSTTGNYNTRILILLNLFYHFWCNKSVVQYQALHEIHITVTTKLQRLGKTNIR